MKVNSFFYRTAHVRNKSPSLIAHLSDISTFMNRCARWIFIKSSTYFINKCLAYFLHVFCITDSSICLRFPPYITTIILYLISTGLSNFMCLKYFHHLQHNHFYKLRGSQVESAGRINIGTLIYIHMTKEVKIDKTKKDPSEDCWTRLAVNLLWNRTTAMKKGCEYRRIYGHITVFGCKTNFAV